MKTFFIILLLSALYYYVTYIKVDNPMSSNGVPKDCIVMSDGCNNCFADNGKLFGCSKLFCEQKETPKCIKFKNE